MNDENYDSYVEMKDILILRSYNYMHSMVDWSILMMIKMQKKPVVSFFLLNSAQELDVFQLQINKNIDFNLLWVNEKELLLIFIPPLVCIFCH